MTDALQKAARRFNRLLARARASGARVVVSVDLSDHVHVSTEQ